MSLKKAYAAVAMFSLFAATAAIGQAPASSPNASPGMSKDAIKITGMVDSKAEVASLMREMETDKFIEAPTLDFVRNSGDRVEFQISGKRPAAKIASSSFDGE